MSNCTSPDDESLLNCTSEFHLPATDTQDPQNNIDTGLVSMETYLAVDGVLEKAVYPLLITALALNAISSMVFSHSSMQGPTSTYLLAYSVNQLLYISLSLGHTILGTVYGDQAVEKVLYLAFSLYVSNFVTGSLRRIMYQLNVFVCLARFVLVTVRFKYRNCRLLKTPSLWIGAAFAITFAFHLQVVFKYEISKIIKPNNQTTYSFGLSEMYMKHRTGFLVLSLFNKITFVYVLVLLCLVLNMCVLYALKRHGRKRRTITTCLRNSGSHRRERQTTLAVFWSTLAFVVLSLPTVTDSLASTLLPSHYGFHSKQRYLYLLMQKIGNTSALFSLTAHFLFHACFSSNFRSTLRVVVCRCFRRGKIKTRPIEMEGLYNQFPRENVNSVAMEIIYRS
ncbi:uncharacterized protein [Haliotis cracherodii]|uniref:uncharacterized protein n=1 Tax=Haliotis cracherodii TaxID=6455 RepID=UPI0039ED8705